MLFKTFISLLSLLLVSCAASDEKVVNEALVSEQALRQDIIFTQYDCPNQYCDNYSITLSADSYSKKLTAENNKLIDKKTLTSEQLKALEQILSLLKLNSMKTILAPGRVGCTSHSSDAASYRFEFYKGQFAQTLEIYAGCHNIPAPYKSLITWFTRLSGNRVMAVNGQHTISL